MVTGKPLDPHIHRRTAKARSVPRSARPAPTFRHPLLGTVLDGKYRIVEHLGSGGVGDVFEAENLRLGRRVAIKVGVGGASGEAIARLRREARAIASLHHPNIRDLYDVGQMENGQLYLVLELLKGETLQARIARVRRLVVREVVDLFQQLLSGLHLAHMAGIVHRDLKPANIFLVARVSCAPLVKLLDFGFALDLSGQLWRRITATGKACGTLHYMSPEQICGEGAGVQSDLFSVGVVMFEALTGQHPFDDTNPQMVASNILLAPPPPMATLLPEIPVALDAIVRRALEKEPSRRFRSALEMQLALSTLSARRGGLANASPEGLPKLGSSPSELPSDLPPVQGPTTPADVTHTCQEGRPCHCPVIPVKVAR